MIKEDSVYANDMLMRVWAWFVSSAGICNYARQCSSTFDRKRRHSTTLHSTSHCQR